MSALRSRNLSAPGAGDATYRSLRSLAVSGRFAPGDRLGEVELSEELGVSRTPVREALRRLQSDGLVEPGARGMVLSALPAAEVQDVYRLRAALEALAAELAAERQAAGAVAPAELSRLRRIAEEMEERTAVGDVEGMTRDNLRLHMAIVQLSANRLLQESLERLWDRISVSSLSNLHDRAWARRVIAHHRELVRAIADGRPTAAAEVARRHVLGAAEVYAAHTDQQGA